MVNLGVDTCEGIIKKYEEIKAENSWFGAALEFVADIRKAEHRRKVIRNYKFINPNNISDEEFRRNLLFLNEESVSKDRVYKKLNNLYFKSLKIKFYSSSDNKKSFGENLGIFSKEIQDKILYRSLSEEDYLYFKNTSLNKIQRHFKKGKLNYLFN